MVAPEDPFPPSVNVPLVVPCTVPPALPWLEAIVKQLVIDGAFVHSVLPDWEATRLKILVV